MKLSLGQEVYIHIRHDEAGLVTWFDPCPSPGDVYPAVRNAWVRIARGPVSGPYIVDEVTGRQVTIRAKFMEAGDPRYRPEIGAYGHYVWMPEDIEGFCRYCQQEIVDDYRGFCGPLCFDEHDRGLWEDEMERRADRDREDRWDDSCWDDYLVENG